jgi:hypothetical protein
MHSIEKWKTFNNNAKEVGIMEVPNVFNGFVDILQTEKDTGTFFMLPLRDRTKPKRFEKFSDQILRRI